jgi:hypothetical protein
LSPGSRARRRMRMPVSSLCSTPPCAACRINSSSAGRIPPDLGRQRHFVGQARSLRGPRRPALLP